jgi:hypothetical protein
VNALQVAVSCVAASVGTLAVLSALSRLRFARLTGAFLCRLGPSSRWRGRRADWRLRRTRVVWVGDVLLVQSGLLRLGVTPVSAQIPREVSVESLAPSEVRRLGPRPVALRLTTADGRPLVVATSARNRTTLVGPFLAASLSGLPEAPRGRGA